MTEQLIFFELDAPEPSRSYTAAADMAAGADWSCVRAMTLEDLHEAAAERRSAIVIHWQQCASPFFAVEAVMQDPALAALPVAVVHERLDQGGLSFLKEYGITGAFPVTVNFKVETERLLAFFRTNHKEAQALRRFYGHLHGERFAEAEAVVDQHLAAALAETEIVFLRGLLLKAQKRFDESMKFLSLGLQLSKQGRSLEPKFLHLIGNVAFKRLDYPQARQFLEAAEKVSPHNLKRLLLLAQVYFEQGDAARALATYGKIHAAWPAYSGIHRRMIQLHVDAAATPADLAPVGPLLAHVEERKLDAFLKKLKPLNPAVRDHLGALAAAEYRRHGEAAVDRDDYFSALKHFVAAIRGLPADRKAEKAELLFRCGEVHLLANNPQQAGKFLAALVELGGADDRVETLKDRIERSQRSATNAAS